MYTLGWSAEFFSVHGVLRPHPRCTRCGGRGSNQVTTPKMTFHGVPLCVVRIPSQQRYAAPMTCLSLTKVAVSTVLGYDKMSTRGLNQNQYSSRLNQTG